MVCGKMPSVNQCRTKRLVDLGQLSIGNGYGHIDGDEILRLLPKVRNLQLDVFSDISERVGQVIDSERAREHSTPCLRFLVAPGRHLAEYGGRPVTACYCTKQHLWRR